jgi:hypothetical protein
MTFVAITSIAFLAIIAAYASVVGELRERNIVNGAQGGYLRSFFKVEAFWRAFSIHLSFGGVSLALAIIASKSKWGFWDADNPVGPLLLSFVMGLLVPSELKDAYDWPSKWAWWISAVAIGIYLYAAWVAWMLFAP